MKQDGDTILVSRLNAMGLRTMDDKERWNWSERRGLVGLHACSLKPQMHSDSGTLSGGSRSSENRVRAFRRGDTLCRNPVCPRLKYCL